MTTPTEFSVESSDGVHLHTTIHDNTDAPTVVLSHSWVCTTALWDHVIAALSPHYRVVGYDQRGHGRSTSPTSKTGYSTTALADDLCAVLDATTPTGEKVVLGGHSMGGMTIMAAAQRPQVRNRAAAVLLASTGSANLPSASRVLPRLGRFTATGHRMLLSAPLPLGPTTPLSRAGIKYIAMAPDTTPETVNECARLVHACPTTTRARWGSVLSNLNVDEPAAQLQVPTVILHGTSDRLIPLSNAHHMATVLPQLRQIIELPGRGHMTPLETPNHVASTITELVETHLRTDTTSHA